jgi:hypothetical protein
VTKITRAIRLCSSGNALANAEGCLDQLAQMPDLLGSANEIVKNICKPLMAAIAGVASSAYKFFEHRRSTSGPRIL